MGTRWSALVYASPATDIAALEAALSLAVNRVDCQMSTWKPESDLMRFNTAPLDVWVSLPIELMRVLDRGLAIGRASDGAFDIGLGALVNAWGFGPAGSTPDQDRIRLALRQQMPPTHTVLELDLLRKRACKHAPFVLDLSGIAKGFAVDEMVRTVRAFGISHALVSLDGELKAQGVKADGTPWIVAVERPDYEMRSPLGVLELRDAAIATSGDYRHWVDLGGKRMSHTMDRARGGPIDNGTASVTVLAESCMDADAWATALLVLSPLAGMALAQKEGLNALFLQRKDGELIQSSVGPIFGSGHGAVRLNTLTAQEPVSENSRAGGGGGHPSVHGGSPKSA